MKGLLTVSRRALLTRLKADPALAAIVAKADIHGQSPPATPTWPFIKLGPPRILPIRGSCIDGGTVSVDIHAFAKPRYLAQAMIETAEDHAGRIGAAIERAVDCRGETVTAGDAECRVTYQLANMLLQRDRDEADAFHYIASMRVRIMAYR